MRGRRAIRRTVVAVAAVAIGGVSMAGCAIQRTAELIPIDGAVRSLEHDAETFGAIAPPSGALPWFTASIRSAPNGDRDVVLWTSDDGLTWKPDPFAENLNPESMVVSEDEGVVMLAIQELNDGKLTTSIWSSDDRTSWVELNVEPDALGVGELRSFTVIDGAAVMTTWHDGEGQIVRIADGDVKRIELPDLPAASAPVDVDGHGKQLVLVAKKDDERAGLRAYSSEDGGKTWTSTPGIPTEAVWGGIAPLANQGYIITGAVETDDGLRPAAWSTADGSRWQTETLPETPRLPDFVIDADWDTSFGGPTVRDGVLGVVQSNYASASSAVLTRSVEGTWTFVGLAGMNDYPGRGGVAVPDTDRVVAGLGGTDRRRFGASVGGTWVDGESHGDSTLVRGPRLESGGLLVQEFLTFKPESASYWTFDEEIELGAIANQTAEDLQLPGEIARSQEYEIARHGGSVLAALTVKGATGFNLVSWHRDRDGEWDRDTIVESASEVSLWGAEWMDGVWFVLGWVVDAEGVHRAAAWTSSDAENWSPVVVESPKESVIVQACDIDGEPSLLGWRAGPLPLAWAIDGDTAEELDLGRLGNLKAAPASCSSSGTVTLVTFKTGERYVRDGDGGWKDVTDSLPGEVSSMAVAIDGGFALAGTLPSPGHRNTAIWLSRDGETWTPVVVPDARGVKITSIGVDGPNLILAMPRRSATPLGAIEDVAQYLPTE